MLPQFDQTARWMRRGGRESDIVLSCRVRLARNLARYEFPHHAAGHDLLAVRARVLTALAGVENHAPDALLVLSLEDFTAWERGSLVDRHLSSREHGREELGRAVAATCDGSLGVLVNEEDHFRVQSILPGLQLDAALALADRLDDALEAHFDTRGGLAFDARLGYLTACPTNAGTGLRASAMLHLPALEITGRLEKVRVWVANHGLTLRGSFGENSRVYGHLHQLSNQSTLGQDEGEITLETEAAALEIVAQERAARAILEPKFAIETRDRIGRAFGTLCYARTISCGEATEALSWLRLGHEMNWMKGVSRQRFNELGVWIRPHYLQVSHGREIRGIERDTLRADLLRPHVAKVKLEAAFEEAD